MPLFGRKRTNDNETPENDNYRDHVSDRIGDIVEKILNGEDQSEAIDKLNSEIMGKIAILREKNKELREDIHRINEANKAKISSSSINSGGNGKYKYNGRLYTVRVGSKGGRYILVGKDKKKVYI